MSEARYQVINLPRASEQLRTILAEAESLGELDLVVRSGKWMQEEMERNPGE